MQRKKKITFQRHQNNLPKIVLSGAHTSKVRFRNELIKQWYLNLSTVEQFCLVASLLQFFNSAALFHSFLVVGQATTSTTLSTATPQYLFSTPHHCEIRIKQFNHISFIISDVFPPCTHRYMSEYCRRGVKHITINQSISQLTCSSSNTRKNETLKQALILNSIVKLNKYPNWTVLWHKLWFVSIA